MTKIIIGNVYSQIIDLDDREIINHLSDILSYWVVGHEFTAAFKKGWWNAKKNIWEKWDGKRHLLTEKLKFHTGLLYRVEAVLKNSGIQFDLIDDRKKITANDPMLVQNIEVRPYQQRVLEISLRKKGGIIRAATGSGKSIMMIQLAASLNARTMVYVTGLDLLYQTHSLFEKILNTEIGIIGDGIVNLKRINICTVWTAAKALGQKKYSPVDDEDRSHEERWQESNKAKIVKAIKEAELVMFDECHMMSCESVQLINNNSISAYYKYGFSGTPWRDDGADLLLTAICGEIIIEITASELIKDGYLVPANIHFINVPKKDLEGNTYQQIYKEYVVENEIRNDLIVKAAIKLVEAGRKVLILVKQIKHGELLLEQLEQQFVVHFIKGDIDSDTRISYKKGFEEGNIDIIIASTVYDQGIDIPILDSLILAGSGKSSGRALQRLGRVIRPFVGKENAIVVDFIDHARYLLNHTAERIKIYRTETGFKIKLPQKPMTEKDVGNANESIKTKQNKKKKIKPMQSKKQGGGKMSW
jgi:superfamily II DNA or RNA helicase